jgi:membrane-associated phospholipid phosphatase
VPVVVLALVALVAGLAVAGVVHRWPAADPTAPHLTRAGRRARAAALVRRHVDPATATGLALVIAGLAVVLGAVLVGIVLVMVRTDTGLERFDGGAARWASTNATDWSTDVLRAVTDLGGTPVAVALAALVAVVEGRRTRSWAVPVFVVLVVGGQNLVTNGVKYLVDRARPDVDPLAGFGGPSFPSGHSATAAATLAVCALLLGRRRPLAVRSTLAGVAAGLAIAVAATRVLLGVHWLTDTIAGLVLGWTWFAACSIAFGGRLLRFAEPVDPPVPAAIPEAAAAGGYGASAGSGSTLAASDAAAAERAALARRDLRISSQTGTTETATITRSAGSR